MSLCSLKERLFLELSRAYLLDVLYLGLVGVEEDD
jgi:hypothetical protein